MAISVGDALLKVGIDTREATSGIENFGKQVQGSIGAIFGVASIAAITAFGKKSIEAFAETEESARTLDNTLKNIGVSDAQISQIEKFVDTLEQSTYYDDSQIRDALKDLTIKFGSADVAMKILTVSMQASRAKGEDLATTTQKIALGLLGNTRGLKDYGIEVKDGTTKMEVLNEIAKKTAGSIETFGEKTVGSSQQMKIAFDNLKESIGKQLSPAINGLLQGLSKSIALMIGAGETSEAYQSTMTNVGITIGAAFGKIINTISNTVTLGISAVAFFMDVLKGNFTKAMAESDTFNAIMNNYKDIWKTTNQDAEDSFTKVMDSINNSFTKTTDFLNTGIKDNSAAIEKAANSAVKDVEDAARKITDTITTYNDTRKDLVSRLTEFVRNQTELERDTKLSAIQDEIDARYDQYIKETGLIDSNANVQISALQSNLDRMAKDKEAQQRQDWLVEKNAALASATTAEEKAKIQKEIQKQQADWQYDNTRELLRSQIDAIRVSAEKQKEQATKDYEADKKLLETKLTDTQKYYDDLLLQRNAELKAEELLASNSMDNVLKMLGDKKSEWASLGTKIGDAFWSNLLGAIGDVEGMKDIFTSLIGTGHAIPTGITGFQGGGIVTRPTMAMIGEGGPEAVVPLSKLEDNESKRLLNEILREFRKLNEITSKEMSREIGSKIAGLGGKV